MQKPKRDFGQLLTPEEETEKLKHKPEHMLMDAIGFTEEDLEANRQGIITDAQKVHFRREYQKSAFAFLPALVILAFFTIGLLSSGLLFIQPGSIVLPFLFFIVYLAYLSWRRQQAVDAIRRGNLESVEGRIQLNTTASNSRQLFTISVQNQKFNIKKNVFLAFKNGDPYVIYYVPRSKSILSAEWLRED